MMTQRKRPFVPRAPHIDEWCNRSEVRDIVATSNPYAPQEYNIYYLIAQAKRGKRKIRFMRHGGHLYLYEKDLRESLRERPVYAGKAQSPRANALLTCIHHDYVDVAPDDGYTWVTPKQVEQITGGRFHRIYSFVKSYRIKALMINNKLHVRLEEAREALATRPGYYIRKLGLSTKKLQKSRLYTFCRRVHMALLRTRSHRKMKRENANTPMIVRHLKWHLAYSRKHNGKHIKRVPFERFFLCGYRFELQIGLIDMVTFERAVEILNSKPHMLFSIAYKTPQLVIDADYINTCLTLKNSKHVLAHPVFQCCYDCRDAAFYIAEDDLILLLKYVDGDSGITVLIPQEQYLKHENTQHQKHHEPI